MLPWRAAGRERPLPRFRLEHSPAVIFLAGACLAGCGPAADPATGRAAEATPSPPAAVAARGRLQPEGRVIRVAGPSDFAVVVSRLLVDQGDRVGAGDLLALTDTHDLQRARVAVLRSQVETHRAAIARREAELEDSRLEHERREKLSDGGVAAEAERDRARARLKVAEAALSEARSRLETTRAELAAAEAQLELTRIRAPRDGRVLQIHTRAGERVGPEGVLDMGATDRMYAIAEVYETDVPRVRPGQRARILSPAFEEALEGTVERVGLQVGRLTALGTDPDRRTDARVVEVEIRLDESPIAADLTNLEVEVLIE